MYLQNFLIAFVLKSRFASDQYRYRTEYATYRINKKKLLSRPTSHTVPVQYKTVGYNVCILYTQHGKTE
jgi:hypothetical protein